MENNEFVKKLSENMFALHKGLNKIIKTTVDNNNITVPQFNVLKALVREDGISLKELSKRVELAHSTVSGIVDRLEEKQVLERRVNEKDKRHTSIYLTEEAKKHRDSVIINTFSSFSEALTSLSSEEQSKVLDGLSILNKIIKEKID